MKKWDVSGADVHKVRPVVRAALKANRDGLAAANARDRADVTQAQTRRLAGRGLKLVKK